MGSNKTMKVAIIKYNAGNVQSVNYALQRLNINAILTDVADEILSADKIIFPGVGAAAPAMNYLKEKKLDVLIKNIHQPFLGVCLGMQLLCNYSEEGDAKCIGIFNQSVKKFTGKEKIPQMGWNNIYDLKSSLFSGVEEDACMYFVHSYYADLSNNTIAKTNYLVEYSSALHKDNFYAVQFHPEKSSGAGEKILKNFIEL